MANELPRSNTLWIFICPDCRKRWASTLGRGRLQKDYRPEFSALKRSRFEVVPPARRLERRVFCARCLPILSSPLIAGDPEVAHLQAKALGSGEPSDLAALHKVALAVLERRGQGVFPFAFPNRLCKECLEAITTQAKRSTRRYCSDACRSKARRRRQRAGKLLQIGEASRQTRVPRSKITLLTESGELPSYRRGDRRYWKAEDIYAWQAQAWPR